MTIISRPVICFTFFVSTIFSAFAQNSEIERLDKEFDRLWIDSQWTEIIQNRQKYMAIVGEGSDEWFNALYKITNSYCFSAKQDLASARVLLDRAYALLSPSSAPFSRGMYFQSLSIYNMISGDYGNAINNIVNAVQTVSDFPSGRDLEKAGIIADFASILQAAGKHKESLQYFESAESLLSPLRTTQSNLSLACLYCNRGVSYRVMGDPLKALEQYKTSEKIFKALNAQTNIFQPVLYSNFQQAYKEIGDHIQVTLYADKALSLAKKIYGHDSYFYANVLVSNADDRDLDALMSNNTEAMVILEKLGLTKTPMYYTAICNIGLVYSSRGKPKEASQMRLKAVKAMRMDSTVDPFRLASILTQLAIDYSNMGEKEKAMKTMEESVSILKENNGDNSDVYFANLINLAILAGNSDVGGELLDQAIDALMKADGVHVRQLIDLMYHMGVQQLEIGEYASAEETLKDALDMAEQQHLESIQLGILFNLAQLYVSIEKYDLYAEYNLKAKALCDKRGIRDNIYFLACCGLLNHYYAEGNKAKTDELSHNIINTLREVARENLSYMTEAEREGYWKQFLTAISIAISSSKNHPDVVYDFALMSKSLLLSSTVELEKLAAESDNPEMASNLKELKKVRTEMASAPSPELKARAEVLENSLALASKDYGKLLSSLSYRWQDVQERLGDGDIAVEILSFKDGHSPAYAVVGIKKGWKSPKLFSMKSDPEDVIGRAINGGFVNAYDNVDWYDNFWKEAAKEINPGANIFFSPDGVLHKAPLEYVPAGNSGKRMCDIFRMHRISSTRELVTGSPNEPITSSAAIFGGLDYDLSTEDMEMRGEAVVRSSETHGEWTYLSGALAEVISIAKTLEAAGTKVNLVTGADGVESSFKSLSGSAPAIIHIATHGFYRNDFDPMENSGLVFAGANSGVTSGILTAKEISLMDLRNSALVVLSACSSGLGEASSEGVAGLQRAFKKAGAGSIVMTLWEINDTITSDMMHVFYANLVKGISTEGAFASALASIRQKHPDFSKWAAFVLLK